MRSGARHATGQRAIIAEDPGARSWPTTACIARQHSCRKFLAMFPRLLQRPDRVLLATWILHELRAAIAYRFQMSRAPRRHDCTRPSGASAHHVDVSQASRVVTASTQGVGDRVPRR